MGKKKEEVEIILIPQYNIGDEVRINTIITKHRKYFRIGKITKWELYQGRVLYLVKFADGYTNKYFGDEFHLLQDFRKKAITRLIS